MKGILWTFLIEYELCLLTLSVPMHKCIGLLTRVNYIFSWNWFIRHDFSSVSNNSFIIRWMPLSIAKRFCTPFMELAEEETLFWQNICVLQMKSEKCVAMPLKKILLTQFVWLLCEGGHPVRCGFLWNASQKHNPFLAVLGSTGKVNCKWCCTTCRITLWWKIAKGN